jgi:hypothetical protein
MDERLERGIRGIIAVLLTLVFAGGVGLGLYYVYLHGDYNFLDSFLSKYAPFYTFVLGYYFGAT